MRIALTGAAGSLMLSLHRRLRASGHEVMTLARGAMEPAAGDVLHSIEDPGSDLQEHLEPFGPEVAVLFPWAGALRRGRRALRTQELASTADSALDAGARRLVFWGSDRVYAAEATMSRPRVERDATRDRGPGSELAAFEAVLRDRVGRVGADCVIFRPVTVLGPEAATALRSLARLPLMPRPARPAPVQLLHTVDAEHVLARAVTTPHPSTYNVAADGLLLHSELCRVLGKTALRMPGMLARALTATWPPMSGLGRNSLLEQSYEGLVLDNTRLKTHFGYRPRYTAREALAASLKA